MQQASECTSTKSIKKRFLFKLAFLSIPRLGFLSLVLLTFGIYMIFPCVSTFLQVHRETSVPYDLSVTADPRDMGRLSEIEGVTKITPVCRIPAQLKTDTSSQSIEVLGVFSSFLPRSFLEGGPFQDDTHTPFLVMNEAAAKAFQTEQGSAAPITLDTRLTLNDQDALMAGILRDGSEQPLCYMSYDTATRGLEQEDQQEFLMTLEHKGGTPKITSHLNGASAALDENEVLRWKLMKQQMIQYFMTAILSIICSGVMAKKRHMFNRAGNVQEQLLLLQSYGLADRDLQVIHVQQTLLMLLCCTGTATVCFLLSYLL